MLRWMAGLALAALLLLRPEAAANGAREAMAQWVHAVAPSLFPFMALMPLLTCAEAASAYERLLGGVTRRLYRLPGAAAPALMVGLMSGSPAGCTAARRVAARAGMTRGQLQRLAVACCGLSPAFYISGIGVALLGSPASGHALLRAQLLTQLLMPLMLMPFCRDDTPVGETDMPSMMSPVLAVLGVCGWMTLFGALAAALGDVLGDIPGKVCLCLMDVTSGARIISTLNIPMNLRIIVLAAMTGFGGLCVCVQNASVLRGIFRPVELIAIRIAAGCLAAGLTALENSDIMVNPDVRPLPVSCIFVCIVLIPTLIGLKRTIT